MDMMKIAAQLFINHLGDRGSSLSLGTVIGALKGLLPTNDNDDLDIGDLVGRFTTQGGSFASLATSWLGDGKNDALDPADLVGMLGEDKVSRFANKVGVAPQNAATGLANMIPELIDSKSEGGNIIPQVAGSTIKGMFKKFFHSNSTRT